MPGLAVSELNLSGDWFVQVERWIESDGRAAEALALIRDGVITGEGPTTKGRVHFSRQLDAKDAALCAEVLTAPALVHAPVSRSEAEMLFAIDEAASERSDGGRFDDLLAKAIVHHAVAASGLAVPPRDVALAPQTEIDCWAPVRAAAINGDVLHWLAEQMRTKRRPNHALLAMTAALIGAAAMPLTQSLPAIADLGM